MIIYTVWAIHSSSAGTFELDSAWDTEAHARDYVAKKRAEFPLKNGTGQFPEAYTWHQAFVRAQEVRSEP